MLQFEKTSDHLFEAAYHGQTDAICGTQNMCLLTASLHLFKKDIQGKPFLAIFDGVFRKLAGLIGNIDS